MAKSLERWRKSEVNNPGMGKKTLKTLTDVGAAAFFNFAREYHESANRLFDLRKSLRNPVYFLYFHAIELALKAFLRSRNISILGTKRQSHKLTELYAECRSLGLRIGPDDRVGIGNIVNLLESGNAYQGFRYFNLEPGITGDLSWTREVAEQLMLAVEPHVEAYSKQNPSPPNAVKFGFTFGKPVPKGTD